MGRDDCGRRAALAVPGPPRPDASILLEESWAIKL